MPLFPPIPKWTIKGRSYVDNLTTEIKDIQISELDVVNPVSGVNINGEAIDARLAIYYINQLWTELKKSEILTIRTKFEAILQWFASLPTHTLKSDDFKANFLKTLEDHLDLTKYTESWLFGLLSNSFAITMDKSLLMKILSQPGCEGLRYYLCLKKLEPTPPPPDGIEPLPGRLTLVTVGVDAEGKDLHYSFDSSLHSSTPSGVMPDVDNISLCSEYPPTPAQGLFNLPAGSPELVPYVLFQYAK